jgi:hypothetical protein
MITNKLTGGFGAQGNGGQVLRAPDLPTGERVGIVSIEVVGHPPPRREKVRPTNYVKGRLSVCSQVFHRTVSGARGS